MSYEYITIHKQFNIDKLYSIHEFDNISDLDYSSRSYPFWKLLFVNAGTVNISRNGLTHTLHKDNIVIFKPNENHRIGINGIASAALFAIGFDCDSSPIDTIQDHIYEINPSSRTLLIQIMNEAHLTYSNHFDNQNYEKLNRITKASIPFASEQMIQVYLELFLILLVREADISKSTQQINEEDLFYNIFTYMQENIYNKLTIEDICADNFIGRSLLQKLFKDYTSCGTIHYFNNMKINKAKQLIRETDLNLSQIADKLNYNSVHYFSRQFKSITGMAPSKYANSVRLPREMPDK